MENFIGTLNINGNVSIQDRSSAEESFKGLLDNTATFKELLALDYTAQAIWKYLLQERLALNPSRAGRLWENGGTVP